MASIFRQTYSAEIPKDAEIVTRKGRRFVKLKGRDGRSFLVPLTKDGKRCLREAKAWYVKCKDADGIERKIKGYTDKEATRQLAAQLEKEAELARAGVVDPFKMHRKRPLREHLEEYRQHLESKEDTAEHIQQTVARIQSMLEGCGFRMLSDLCAQRVAEWLADARRIGPESQLPRPSTKVAKTYADIARSFGVSESTVTYWRRNGAPIQPRKPNDLDAIWRWRCDRTRKSGGISTATSNHHLRAIKSFALWLVRGRRIQENPFAHLASLNVEIDIRRERRPLNASEFAHLIETTRQSPKRFRGMSGRDRAMLYLTASHTGLRASELASLSVASFDFDADVPVVKVEAAYSKRRRTDIQPIRPDLAETLREWCGNREADNQKLWPGNWSDDAAEMLSMTALGKTGESSAVFLSASTFI